MDWVTGLALALFIGLITAIGTTVGILAKRKGYEFWLWFFAGALGFGIPALIALGLLPFANAPNMSDGERQFRIENGNQIGRRLVGILALLIVIRLLMRIS